MLSRARLTAYALPALPLAALSLAAHVHLPTVYAGGIGLAAAGTALLVSRLVDGVIDPLIGLACDRGRLRRKLWLALGLPLLAVAGWALFRPPPGAGAVYLGLWSSLFYLGLTALLVPYQAWGTELSDDYRERTRVAGWREAAALCGMIAALALPAVLALPVTEALKILYPPLVILLAAATGLVILTVPEPQRGLTTGRGSLRVLLENRPFRRLLAAQALNALANALPATLFLLFVGDGLGAPDLSGPLLLAYLLTGVLSVPLWLRLARSRDKHRLWAASLAFTAAAFLPVAFLGTGDGLLFIAFCLLTGIGLGADLCLPAAMLADVTDEQTARTGDSRAGLYVALWSLTGKLALALAVGLAFPLLDLAGFMPGSGQAPLALPLLYAALPVALKLAAALLIRRYPLDAARQASLRHSLSSPDPETPP
ncbi:MFS transporter [Novispirillum itersonii]|uniref:MFS transporter n=1 Tax=Novispirillum itersonii TaxID=189 RepID=UPI00035D6697|nr:MFS transporter [Novispirillum itersonii]